MEKQARWTNDDLEKLRQIYQEEYAKGTKRLWVRITQRINQNVRKAKRQAIQYKWKNFCRIPKTSIKLRQNQRLIEILLTQIPHKGYKSLANSQNFAGITQSNLKNVFYSNIRSMSHFLHMYLHANESIAEITNMFKNRKFLLLLQSEKIDFPLFRRDINSIKKKIAGKKIIKLTNDAIITRFKQAILDRYAVIKRLFRQMTQNLESKNKSIIPAEQPKPNGDETSTTFIKQIQQPYQHVNNPISMEYLDTFERIPARQKKKIEEFPKFEEEKSESLVNYVDWQNKMFTVKSNQVSFSSQWLCNDF